MREIAGRVKYVLIAGDIVDGVGVYPNQIKELVIKTYINNTGLPQTNRQYQTISKSSFLLETMTHLGKHSSARNIK